jgi:carbonic anhydrase
MTVHCPSSRPSYSWTYDISAGLVVFLVALPLCLGIALACKAPIISGLLAGIVGGIVVGIISGSHTSVSGPAAGLTAIIAAQISSLGSFETFLAAVFIAGLIQMAMGLARTGFISAFFPNSVIKGLLAAIGAILILKQLPHLVGLDTNYIGEMAFLQADNENTFSMLDNMFIKFHPGATIVGIISLFLLIAWDQVYWLKNLKIPAPLVIVVAGTLINMFFLYSDSIWIIGINHRVQMPIPNGISGLTKLLVWPDFTALLDAKVLIAGITIAVVASLETLLNLEAVDKIDPQQRISPPNRELIAQGAGNMILGLIGGIPVTSVVVRGSVNINANAKTKNSAIIHGFLLLICVLALPQIINQIPLSCLAAILIITGFKLASPKIIKQMWSQGINQFLPFLVTFIAIMFTDLLIGVLIGLVTSIFFILKNNFNRPIMVVKENLLGREVKRIILANQVSFLNKAAISKTLTNMPDSGHIVLDASDTDLIDIDVLDMIKDFKEETAPKRGITISLVGFKERYSVDDCVQFADYSTCELQKNATPQQILECIKDGNLRVREGRRLKRDLNHQILATSSGQFPLAAILSCIDSRVPAELIFDMGIGDAFSIRMAGNVISQKILGSLEFACAVAGAKLIVVMGHTRCGAISAALDSHITGQSVQNAYGCKHLSFIINDIQKVITQTFDNDNSLNPISNREAFLNQITVKNVLQSIDSIRTKSAVLASLLAKKRIAIAGCVYDVTTGEAKFLNIQELSKKDMAEVMKLMKLDLAPCNINVQ